jgi:putative transposase
MWCTRRKSTLFDVSTVPSVLYACRAILMFLRPQRRESPTNQQKAKATDLVRQFQARFAKAMEIFEAGIDDVLSYLHYPQPHRTRISSTNPLERLNLEIRRRTRVVGIFPHAAACLRLVGMLLVEKNDDWLTDDKAYLTFDDAPVEQSATKVVSMAAAQ